MCRPNDREEQSHSYSTGVSLVVSVSLRFFLTTILIRRQSVLFRPRLTYLRIRLLSFPLAFQPGMRAVLLVCLDSNVDRGLLRS